MHNLFISPYEVKPQLLFFLYAPNKITPFFRDDDLINLPDLVVNVTYGEIFPRVSLS